MTLELTVISLDFEADTTPSSQVFDEDHITIGSDASNNLIVHGTEVAIKHARVRYEPESGKLYVSDLGSRSGTLVENRELPPSEEVEINSGTRIIVGSNLIRINILESTTRTGRFISLKDAIAEKPSVAVTENISETSTQDEVASEEFNFSAPSEAEENFSFKDFIDEDEDLNTDSDEEDKIIIKKPQIDPIVAPAAPVAPQVSPVQAKTESKPVEAIKPVYFQALEPEVKPATAIPSAVNRISEITGEGIRSSEAHSLVLDLNPVLNMDFDALELLELNGQVKHRGQSLAGVNIDAGSLGTATTDNKGEFKISDIPEGTPFTLKARKTGYSFDTSITGKLEQGTKIEFSSIKLLTVGGTISHKGKPVAGVTVDAGSFGKTVTDANGKYEFKDVPENTKLNISAYKDKFIFVKRS